MRRVKLYGQMAKRTVAEGGAGDQWKEIDGVETMTGRRFSICGVRLGEAGVNEQSS